jgi:hypothetical protein
MQRNYSFRDSCEPASWNSEPLTFVLSPSLRGEAGIYLQPQLISRFHRSEPADQTLGTVVLDSDVAPAPLQFLPNDTEE